MNHNNNLFAKTTLPPLLVDIPRFLQFKQQHQFKNGYSSITTDYETYLYPPALAALRSLGLEPEVLIAFGHENDLNFSPRVLVHKDVKLVENHWEPVPLSLNCEVVGGGSISWFDTSKLREIPPEVFDPPPTDPLELARYTLGNGHHYGKRYRFGTTLCVPLGTLTFEPLVTYVINTSVPHAVHYRGLANRLNISIRFKDSPSFKDILQYEMF